MEKPSKIIAFHAENTKKLRVVDITPDQAEPVVLLTGKNRQGKSSILDSIWYALGGEKAVPGQPIRTGEESASVTVEFPTFTVTRRFTPNNSYLEVKNKDGFKAPSPQQFLNSKLSTNARNPLEFMRLAPAEQVKVLQGMVDIRLEREQFEQVTGLKPKDLDGDPIAIIDEAYQYLYGKRTDVNKEVKRLEGAVKSIEIPAGMEGVEPVSVQELFAERKGLEAQTKEIQDHEKTILEEARYLGEKQKAIGAVDTKIAELMAEIEELKAERIILVGSADDVNLRLANLRARDIPPLPDFTDIDARIAAADETNRVAAQVEQRHKLTIEYEAAVQSSVDLTDRLNAIKDYKGRLIEAAGLPVPGLGFENGQVTFNGLPLSQASGAEQIQISCSVCMAQAPQIGVLTVDAAWSELDGESQQVLRDWATKTGAQIWVTRVMDQPGDEGFFIEDGSVVAVNGVPVATFMGANEHADGPVSEKKNEVAA